MKISPLKFDHGLNAAQLQLIKAILTRSSGAIDRVALFGSRASGKYRRNSDIDLVIYGDLNAAVADRLWTLFADSVLPYKVDVNIYQHITHQPLVQHIDARAKTLFTKQQLYADHHPE